MTSTFNVKFQFMKMIELLEAKAKFDEDGYVFIPSFLNMREIEQINSIIDQFIDKKVADLPARHVFYEDESDPTSLKQLQDLHIYDPFFSEMLFNSTFKTIAEVLLEDRVVGKTLQYFNKPARIGKPTPPHQDGYYFMLEPSVALTMWMALDEVDAENGCVRYIRGSHLKGMRPHGRTNTLGFSQGITDYGVHEDLEKDEIAFPAKPGDVLIHHSMTIHVADGNKSNSRSRRALGFIYFGASARENTDAKTAYLKLLHEEREQKHDKV